MNLKSILVSAAALTLTSVAMTAEQAWHVIIDGNEDARVPASAVEYIVSNPQEHTLDVVMADNATVHRGVSQLTFKYCEGAGVAQPSVAETTILGPYNDVITVSGLKAGATIAIYDLNGVELAKHQSQGESQELKINISSLQNGVYILSTANTAVKFVKH